MTSLRGLIASLTAVVALGTGAAAQAECLSAPDLAYYQNLAPLEAAAGVTQSDRFGRVVAPVTVNGRGPYRFIVDTGANRSVVSEHLMVELGLTPSSQGQVNTIQGVVSAPLVEVNQLSYGGVDLSAHSLPVLSSAVFGGTHGLLGVDGMAGRRLRLDFDNNCIEITPSQGASRLRGWIALEGELRFGHLVVMRGSIYGVPTNLIIDTGSDTSLANNALRERLATRIASRRNMQTRAMTASQPIMLENAVFVRRLTVGDLEVTDVTAFVGDFHIFGLWDLLDEPTLLIGMDVLSQARGLAIDYGRGMVFLQPRAERSQARASAIGCTRTNRC